MSSLMFDSFFVCSVLAQMQCSHISGSHPSCDYLIFACEMNFCKYLDLPQFFYIIAECIKLIIYYATDVENKYRLSKVTGVNLDEAYFNCCVAIPDYNECKGMQTMESRHYYPQSLIIVYYNEFAHKITEKTYLHKLTSLFRSLICTSLDSSGFSIFPHVWNL